MKKGLSLLFLILLIHHNLVNANNCVTEDCLIGNDLESEFSFGSHAARMLYDVSQSATGRTGNGNNPSVDCSRVKGYRSCLPSKNSGGTNINCADYTRDC